MARPKPKAPIEIEPESVWLLAAKSAAHSAINDLAIGFLRHPFLHRVEHSLHVELVRLLVRAKPDLALPSPLRNSEHHSQAIHKEWPETFPRDGNGRGNFDLALVSPNQLSAADPKEFRGGWIKAAIVIEMGLDYGWNHLKRDRDKLVNSKATVGYLIHLQRTGGLDDRTLELVRKPGSDIQTTYVHHHLDKGTVTHNLAESVIRTEALQAAIDRTEASPPQPGLPFAA
jgi:hypothetical protein